MFRKHTKRVCAGQTFSPGEIEVQEMLVKLVLTGAPVTQVQKHRSFARWARKVQTMKARCEHEAERLKELGNKEARLREQQQKGSSVPVQADGQEVSKAG